MLNEIASRFEANLGRSRNLIDIYDRSISEGGKGVFTSDLLRVAVVLLHASLEDLLRSLAEWKLPTAEPGALEAVPLSGTSDPRRRRFSMTELAKHRGSTVNEIVRESVRFYLERSSYNDVGQIRRLIEMCGGDPNVVNEVSRWVGPMLRRRHWIVHRADRSTTTTLEHEPQPLAREIVEMWFAKVEQLGRGTLDQFR